MEKKFRVVMAPDNHKYILSLKKSLEAEGIEVILLPSFHYATPYNFIKLLMAKRNNSVIFHIHWAYIFPSTVFMKILIKLLKKIGYKIVWTIHDIHEAAFNKFSEKEKLKWLYQNVNYKFLHYKANIAQLKNNLNVKVKNVEIIYHPYFVYPNNILRDDARKILGLHKNKKVLLSLGLIKKYKGLRYLTKAMEKFGNEYICLIVGKGKDRNILKFIKKKEKMIKNIILIDEYIHDENLQIYFNACDVVVLPYESITTSGVVLLAYSFHRPVITTNLGGLSEVVVNGQTGLLIPPKNVTSLTNAMKKIFIMDYIKMGENAYNLAMEKFSWEKLAEQTIKIYEKIIR